MSRPARGRDPRAAVAVVAAFALLLAACTAGGDGGDRGDREQDRTRAVRSAATDVPFTPCRQVACTGELAGAAYEIRLPRTWNGTLLLYSHGYRQVRPAPPDYRPVTTAAAAAPTEEVAAELLRRGYALAGSAYRSNGWAVAEGMAAGEQLRDFFVERVGRPHRTYLWGDSLGGLITQLLAEKHPDWVDGAAPLCGVLAGTNRNFDLALDLAFAVQALVHPPLAVAGYASHEEAVAAFRGAYQAVLAATRDTATGLPRLLLIAALVDGPAQTGTYDGSTLRSRVAAIVESIVTGLVFSTVVRQEIEQRVGGNPSGNAGVDYRPRVSAAERRLIETLAPGSVDRNLAVLAGSPRVVPDRAARSAFERLGTPTGELTAPTITLHTRADPLVLVQNETVFAAKVRASTRKTADLVQLYTEAPPRYAEPAPYGAGHCNFTTDERVGVVTLLDDWVRHGRYPVGPAVTAAFGAETGLNLAYRPGPWPATG
jgi:pimeloyl-ACP methyl ester carboxylesterase